MVRNIAILAKQRNLEARVRKHLSENSKFFNIYLPATDVTMLPLRIFMFCHMVAMTLIIQ